MRKYAIWAIPVILLVSAVFQFACSSSSGTVAPGVTYDASHPPQNLQWNIGNERITLSWDHVPFAEGYRVYLSHNGIDFDMFSGSKPIAQNQITVTEVQNGSAHFLGVSAIGTSGKETIISYPGGSPDAVPLVPTSIAPDEFFEVPPAAPANLQGFAGDRIIQLDWDPNTEPDLDRYIVYARRSESPEFSAFPSISAEENTWFYDDASNGVTYFFKVTATDLEELESDFSNMVHYTPQSAPPLMPVDFTAEFVPFEGIVLNWDGENIESDIYKYRIMRYDWTDGSIEPFDVMVITLIFPEDPLFGFFPPLSDSLLIPHSKYQYELAAIDVEDQFSPPALSEIIELPT